MEKERITRNGYHGALKPDTADGCFYRSGGFSAHHCRLYEYYDHGIECPTRAGASVLNKPNFTIEVIVRKAGLEIANGASVEAAIPKIDDKYDLKKLTEMLLRLKAQYPEKEDATVLMEPKVEYDQLIQVMDVVRSAEVRTEGSKEVDKIVLFPKISIGDAP